MSRRVSLPTADDLFRPTVTPPEVDPAAVSSRTDSVAHLKSTEPEPATQETDAAEPKAKRSRKPSGRVRHDEKMTVYVTADELLDLEHARLTLRRDTGLAVDRGRLVREAVAIALADLEANGEDSVLVQRLQQS